MLQQAWPSWFLILMNWRYFIMYMFCLGEIRWATVNIPPTTIKLLVSCLTLKSCTVHLHSCAGVIGAHHDRLSRGEGFYFMLDGLGSQGYLGVRARYLETVSTGDGLSGLDYPSWRSFNRSSTARLFATFIKACQHKVDTSMCLLQPYQTGCYNQCTGLRIFVTRYIFLVCCSFILYHQIISSKHWDW